MLYASIELLENVGMPFHRLISTPFKSPSLIVVGACLLVAAISGLTGVALYEMRQDALARARELAGNISLVLERDIARSIEVYDLSLQAVIDGVDSPEVMALPPAMRQLVLFDRSSNAKYLGSMLVIDPKGQVVVDSRSVTPRTVQLADRDYFQVHRDHPDAGLFISAPFMPRTTEPELSIGLSRRLNDVNHAFSGVVVGTLRLRYFHQLFEGVELGPKGSITLLGTNGTVYMRRPYDEKAIGANFSGTAAFQRTNRANSGSFFSVGSLDGVERLYTYHNVGDYPLIVSVGIASDDIFAEWRKRAWLLGSIVAALNVLLLIGAVSFTKQLRRRIAIEGQLQILATTDGLTGLATRRAFDEAFDVEWRRANREGNKLALLMIDVDEFKHYNDQYGHGAGDLALRSIAECIGRSIRRPGDMAGRYGGEEFSVLLPNTDIDGALRVAEKIRANVRMLDMPHSVSKHGRVTVSVGVAMHEGSKAETPGDFLRRADVALYAAKGTGRDAIEIEVAI